MLSVDTLSPMDSRRPSRLTHMGLAHCEAGPASDIQQLACSEHKDLCTDRFRPELGHQGPLRAHKRELAHGGCRVPTLERLVHQRRPQEAVRGREEAAGVQAAPQRLGGVHQVLDAPADRCNVCDNALVLTEALTVSLP